MLPFQQGTQKKVGWFSSVLDATTAPTIAFVLFAILSNRRSKPLRIWLASIGERPHSSTDPPERAFRMSLLADAIVRAGGEVTWWSTAFDHTHKRVVTPRGMRYKVGPRYEVILSAAPGYKRNVSVRRLIFNFRTSRRIAQLAVLEPKPDLILTSYPPIEVVSEVAAYGRRHSIPTIADIRDLWPDIWLDAAPDVARPIAKRLLTLRFRGPRWHRSRQLPA